MRRELVENEFLGLLPGVVRVTEVTVRSGLEVLRPLEVELIDNDTWTEVPVLPDNLDELGVGLRASSVGINVD